MELSLIPPISLLIGLLPTLLLGPERKGTQYPWKKNKDPATAQEVAHLFVVISKVVFTLLSYVGPRKIIRKLFPTTMTDVCYFENEGVAGKVALTLDDAFVRQNDRMKSMIPDVKKLLKSNLIICLKNILKYNVI